ncbi:hypothetical protein RJ639_005329 [Escallonia herrerae]|uniref:GDSL esterase/lipase n=1 Tax=Escallonia herrerae TaxID=1293975 RepID=A0AA88VWA4_9ASTE|nr:hypothetical protein RJ639_005329 [Escallonia herrerae]
MSEQVQQFRAVENILTAVMGEESARKLLSQSVFVISNGSNDIFAYFMRLASGQPVPTPGEFITSQLTAYESYITVSISLNNLSEFSSTREGMSINIMHVAADMYAGIIPPLSKEVWDYKHRCHRVLSSPKSTPHQPWRGLFRDYEQFCHHFPFRTCRALARPQLKSPWNQVLHRRHVRYDHACVRDPSRLQQAHFTEVEMACCGTGRYNAEDVCNIRSRVCQNRSNYLFWDLYHLTEAAAHLAADYLYHGDTTFVTPINFSQLVTILLNTEK